MNQAQWATFIRQNAPRYGVDPRAALAVASVEGLSGKPGDYNTSFGPFQLHRGGALPAGRGRAWAESPAGISYALQQIGQVAGGLHGRAAIENIVRRFERPADPTGEVARALGQAPSFSVGTAGAGLITQGAPPLVRGRAGQTFKTETSQVFNPGALAQRIFATLAGGGTPDIASLVGSSYQNVTTRIPVATATKAFGPRPSPAAVPTKGGWADPATGKIIGTPFHGTHTLGNWESDRAIDVAVPIGTPVRAPFAGVVGSQFGSLGADPNSRFGGLRLHIASPQNEWYGAHLSRFAPNIRPGARVTPGEVIGYSGSASGVAHLHEALRSGNPYRLIQ